MNLFDLFTNPIMIIVAIGIISKLFKNQKVEDKKPRQPNAKLDPMHPKHFEQKSRQQDDYEIKQETPNIEKNISRQSEVYYPIELTSNEKSSHEVPKSQIIEPLAPNRAQTRPVKSTKREQVTITKSKIIEGVIWSEILGPPRAQKKWSQK